MTRWLRSIIGTAAFISMLVVIWAPADVFAVVVDPYTFSGDIKGAPGQLITFNLDVARNQPLFSFFVAPEVISTDLTFQSVTAGAALDGFPSFGDACGSTSGKCGGIFGTLNAGRVLSWTFKINDDATAPMTTVTADIKFTVDASHSEQDLPISIPIKITQAIPEPASAVLLILGLGALGLVRIRRV